MEEARDINPDSKPTIKQGVGASMGMHDAFAENFGSGDNLLETTVEAQIEEILNRPAEVDDITGNRPPGWKPLPPSRTK